MNGTKASRASLKLRKDPFKGKRLRNQAAVIFCSLVIKPTQVYNSCECCGKFS